MPASIAERDALVAEVAAILHGTLDARRAELAAIAPEAARLVDVLRAYLADGKMLRPLFCCIGGAAVHEPSPAERERLCALGAAIELVQAAALLHDDVIDHSETRRGRPAVHVSEADEHRRLGLAGDPVEHGEAVAIVLGDLALTWSDQLAAEALAGAPDPASRAAARAQFDLLRTEVMTGQYLDILHQAGGFVSHEDPEEAALAVVRWKTVPYTVLRPLLLGAASLGAGDALLADLSRYAEAVGEGFQLRDDLLGVLGDEAATGKSASSDIREGKRTLLLARTSAAADAAGRALLADVVGRADASDAEVEEVRALMVSTGAAATVAQRITEDAAAASAVLQGSEHIDPAALPALAALARTATDLSGIAGLDARA